MNANVNIMSATSSSTSATSVKAAQNPIRDNAKTSSSGQQDSNKDGSFSNVLDKTQQDKEPQDKPDIKDASSDGAKDPISQAIAAVAVQQNANDNSPGEASKAVENPAEQTAAAALASKVLVQENSQGKAGAAVAMVVNTAGMEPQLAAAVQPLAQSATASDKSGMQQPAAIEALLQQGGTGTAGEAVTNQQLLAMLSGGQALQQTAAAGQSATVQTAVQEQSIPVVSVLNAPMENTGSAKDSQLTNSTVSKSSFAGLWGNAGLSVENQGQSAAQQQLSGGMQQGNENAFQQQGQNPQQAGTLNVQPAVTADAAAVPQLPEEAQFDTAMPKDTGRTDTTGAQAAPLLFQQTLQDASSVQSNAASQAANQPQTDYDIPKQIVDQARLIKSTEDTQMVIKLKPEHLGELTLKVSVTANGSVNASFHSDNAQVRAAIESSMVQLRQELQAQGIRVDHVDVYAGLGDGSLGSSQQQYQQSQQGGNALRSQQVDQAAFEEEAEGFTPAAAADSTAVAASDSGVDYRI